jgi:hypothetical protein
VVKRDTKTVEISPTRELREGNIKRIIGIVYKISLFEDKKLPEKIPNIDEITTIANDSLNTFLKYSILWNPQNYE